MVTYLSSLMSVLLSDCLQYSTGFEWEEECGHLQCCEEFEEAKDGNAIHSPFVIRMLVFVFFLYLFRQFIS